MHSGAKIMLKPSTTNPTPTVYKPYITSLNMPTSPMIIEVMPDVIIAKGATQIPTVSPVIAITNTNKGTAKIIHNSTNNQV